MTPPTAFLGEPPLSPEVTAAYDADLSSDGYVNNLTRVWCWRPDMLSSFQALRAGLLTTSSLSDREVAVMVVAAASARGDSYCALAWGQRLARLSDETTAGAVLQGGATGLSERETALAAWARQVVVDPNGATRADVAHLREVGLGDREIFEATAWVALRLAFSTVNDALGAVPDRELVDLAPAAVREAVLLGRREAE